MEKPAPTAPPPTATDKAATFALMALVLVWLVLAIWVGQRFRRLASEQAAA